MRRHTPMPRARRSAGTLGLVALLVASIVACTGPADPGPSSGSAEPGVSAPAAPVAVTVDEAIEALADAGIPVYDEPLDTTPAQEPAAPVSPYALLRFQVEQLARDATVGGGVPADELDVLIPMPDGTVPMSAIVAGYVATGLTPGSRFAATLMADQDFEHPARLWFPTIVLSLFVGEVAGAATALAPAAVAPATAAVGIDSDLRLAAADPCGDFSRFFGGVIGSIKDAILSVIPHIPFIGAAIDWALGKLADAAKELLGQVPFLTALRKGVQLLALAATVVTALRDWPVSVTSDPGAIHRSVGAQVQRMTMTASVDDGPGDLFSQPVRNCASLLNITLPQGGVVGSKVEWRIVDGGGHIVPGGQQDKAIDGSKRAKFAFDMADESMLDHDQGKADSDPIRVEVTIKRQDVEQVRTLIREMITDAIPPTVWDALVAHFGDPIAKLTTWTDPKGSGYGLVGFHLPPDPTPSPSESPSEAPPSGSPPPSVDPADGEFCRRWRNYLDWAREEEGSDLTRALAAAIVMQFEGMRPVAPPELAAHVAAISGTYKLYATAPDEIQVPLAGQLATEMYEGLLAIDRYCRTNVFPAVSTP